MTVVESTRVLAAGSPRELVRAAFSDVEHDYTRGSIRRAVVVLAIPMVLEMGMESLFAIVDIFFVAFLGPAAIAAVGLTEALMTLLYAVGVGLGLGVTALVARRIDAGDAEGAAVVAGQSVWLGLAVCALVAVCGAVYAEELLRLMGADAAVIAQGTGYTRVLFGGSFTVVYLFLFNAVFRGAGAPLIALRALVLANTINILLDPCFIFGLGPFPALGVSGAAVATTCGRSVGVAYLVWVLMRRSPRVRLEWRHLRPRVAIIARLVAVSLGGIVQFLIATASWVVLMRLMSVYGAAAIAGYTVAIRIMDFTILPAWGLSNAAATLVGQNLGAGSIARARASAWTVTAYCIAFMLAIACLFVFANELLVGLFVSTPEVARHAADCLRYVAYCYGFLGASLALTHVALHVNLDKTPSPRRETLSA